MSVQAEYLDGILPAVAGMIANMVPATMISRTVEDAAGIAFGKPVAQGVNDKGCKNTVGATAIVGITVRERSVSAEADLFAQYEEARIMTKGVIWVEASVAVVAGDIVHVIAATGAFAKTGGVLIPNARWETSAGIGELAQIRLG
jgi:hypothetical protein